MIKWYLTSTTSPVSSIRGSAEEIHMLGETGRRDEYDYAICRIERYDSIEERWLSLEVPLWKLISAEVTNPAAF